METLIKCTNECDWCENGICTYNTTYVDKAYNKEIKKTKSPNCENHSFPYKYIRF